jgi:hypothetical protein
MKSNTLLPGYCHPGYCPLAILKTSLLSPWRGLRGAEEVDEAEDYEAPGSNPGQEL